MASTSHPCDSDANGGDQWSEDLLWRQHCLEHAQEMQRNRDGQRAERQLQLEQQMLDNARVLWYRHVRDNQRAVDEAAEKLRNLASLAALLSGSAMAAFLNFSYTNVSDNDQVLPWYALSCSLTIGLELNACVLCTLLLGSSIKVAKTYCSEEEEAEFLQRCRQFALDAGVGSSPPQPRRTFEAHWANRCEARWRQALLLFLLGIPSFFLNMGTAGYLKFILDPASYWIVAALMIVALLHVGQMNWKWSGQLLGRHEAAQLGDDGKEGWQGARCLSGDQPSTLPWAWHSVPAVDTAWPLASQPAAGGSTTSSSALDVSRRTDGSGAGDLAAPSGRPGVFRQLVSDDGGTGEAGGVRSRPRSRSILMEQLELTQCGRSRSVDS